MRKAWFLALVLCFTALPTTAQDGGRPRRVTQQPAATVSAPKPAASEAAEPTVAVASFSTVPFAPGETLTYAVDWNNYSTAATVVMTVGNPGSYFGQNGVLPISAKVETVGMVRFVADVDMTFDAYSNPKTILPLRSEFDRTINGKSESGSVTFDRTKNVATSGSRSTPIAAETGDPLSLFYRLRAMPLKVGDTIVLDTFDGQRRGQVQAVVQAKEAIAGKNAIRVAFLPVRNGQPDDSSKIRVWFADNAGRIPLLVTAQPEFGNVKMKLTNSRGAKA